TIVIKMKKSVQLRQQRAAIVRAQKAVLDKAKAENREFTPEETADLEAKDGEIADLDAQIETAEKNEEREDRFVALNGESVGNGYDDTEDSSEQREIKKMQKRFSFTKAVREASAGR